jgi:hypothetical protein
MKKGSKNLKFGYGIILYPAITISSKLTQTMNPAPELPPKFPIRGLSNPF